MKPIKRFAKELKDLIVKPTGTTKLMDQENDIHATVLEHPTGKAILLHWSLCGDYTHAMLIPKSEFDDYGNSLERVEETVEAFYDKI